MIKNIWFENHQSFMQNMPIILHMNTHHSSQKIKKDINWHENIELLHLTNGEGYVSCDETTIKAKCNDIIVINSNVLHSFYTDSHMEYNCIIIDRDFALKNGLDTSKRHFTEHISDDLKLTNYFKNLYDVMSEEYEYIDVASVVLPILCYLYHNYSIETSNEKKGDNIIKDAITYILQNIQCNISIDEITEKIGISKYYFIRKFKKYVGYTPIQYINIQRCEMAKILLKEKNHSIKQIAKLCGFEDASYFSKVFYKYNKVHPSDYR